MLCSQALHPKLCMPVWMNYSWHCIMVALRCSSVDAVFLQAAPSIFASHSVQISEGVACVGRWCRMFRKPSTIRLRA